MKAKETWRKNEKRISQLKSVDKELNKAKDEVFKIATSSPKDLAAYFEKKTKQLIKDFEEKERSKYTWTKTQPLKMNHVHEDAWEKGRKDAHKIDVHRKTITD